MENSLISFGFDELPIRIARRGEEVWFIATDVAKVLGYEDARHMTRMLDDDEIALHEVETRSTNNVTQRRELSIISESGLYTAIFNSQRPEAKRFRKWVTSEVLPSIRKTGAYSIEPTPPAPPPIAGPIDTARLSSSIAAIREARRLYGPAAARSLWSTLGLPVGTIPANHDDGALADAIRRYVGDATEVQVGHVAEALGVHNPNRIMVRRIKDVLIELGFAEYMVKRRNRSFRVYQRREG